MVNGLSRFREAFAAHQGQFTLIGGAAASEWFDQAGLQFGATEDLDVVLLLESLDDEFLRTFWSFVREGGYQTKQRSDGSRGYYRFMKPATLDFPWMLELFARRADGLVIAEDQEIVPIPPEEDTSSLSAILMDPDGCRRLASLDCSAFATASGEGDSAPSFGCVRISHQGMAHGLARAPDRRSRQA